MPRVRGDGDYAPANADTAGWGATWRIAERSCAKGRGVWRASAGFDDSQGACQGDGRCSLERTRLGLS